MAVTLTVANSHLYGSGGTLPNTASPFSINVWINATWNGGARLSFVGLYNGTPATGTPTNGSGLQIGTTGGGDVLCWTYGGTTMVTSAAGILTASNGQWVMITYTWDGTNHRLYVNGVQTATSTTVPASTQQMTQVYINGYPPTGNTNECAAFSVDSYANWSRALSANEVLTLYNNQGARGGATFGLAARYEFDDGSTGATVTAVADVSAGGNPIAHTGTVNTATYTYSVGTVNNVANSNTRPVL